MSTKNTKKLNPNLRGLKDLAGFTRSPVFRGLLLCLAVNTPAAARIDAMQLRLLEPYSQDLRWDNIESSPEWISGVEPEYSDDWEMHRVSLAPRQHSTFSLPAYQSLRLYHPTLNLNDKELDVYLSNGSGLGAKQTLQTSTDGHSLVLSPNAPAPMLIHVTRPAFQKENLEVALFVSRKVPINEIAPYRNLIWSTARWCLLGQEPFALPELYNQLSPQQKQRFTVTGPARLALKNRLQYEQPASELIQDYRLRYWLDEDTRPFRFSKPERSDNAHELNFSTSVETSRIVTVNAQLEVVGREEQDYIEIPQGEHTLTLEADRTLYIQVLAQTEDDYLFTHLNNPRLPVEDIRQQGLLPSTELKRQEQIAKHLTQDNYHQASGMVASNLLREAALKRPDYPEGLTEAERLRGFRTFYRDLLPSNKATSTAQFMAYFLSPALQAINRPQSDTILADQHLSEALKRVSSAYFTNIDSTAVNEYRLPEQHTGGQLRFIVDKRACLPRLLRVEINAQAAKDIWLRCEIDQEPEDFTRPLAETALIRLQEETNSFNVTLDARFSAQSEPARLINTAVYELPLPKDARRIKIWQASTESNPPVNIAVQYRAAKPFLLSEHSYLSLLRDTRLESKPRFGLPLQNEWLALQRLLASEERLYKASVADTVALPKNTNPSYATTETRLAQNAEQSQHWLEALEHWGKVVNFSDGLTRQHAQLAQATLLNKLGEPYLAESLRRYLSLTADAVVAEQAIEQLSQYYQAQNNNASLLTLAAAMHVHRPTAAHSRLLLDALMKNHEYRFALLFGISFVEQPPLESLLTAAYQLEWWESYAWLQAKLPPDKQAFWQGLKAQQQGDMNAALQAWSTAELKPWHDYLQRGLVLHDTLTKVTEQNALALYAQWSQWQQQNPSAKTWQNALWHIKDYAGSDSYYAIERDVYSTAVRATTERPVVLTIIGPTTLNLQFRPLHTKNSADPALNGWLTISDNKTASQYPFINNLPAQGLDLSGFKNLKGLTDGFQLGNAVNLVYQVGQGYHEVQLSSAQAPLSFIIQEQRPELMLSVLPILNADSFAEMGFISRLPKDQSIFIWRNLWHY